MPSVSRILLRKSPCSLKRMNFYLFFSIEVCLNLKFFGDQNASFLVLVAIYQTTRTKAVLRLACMEELQHWHCYCDPLCQTAPFSANGFTIIISPCCIICVIFFYPLVCEPFLLPF
jgi:hypothetical protein